jgi:tetratricopeptide (TPR) repeat protein
MRSITFCCLCLLLWVSPLLADTIVLRDGGTISGKIVEENDEAVTLDVPGGRVKISRDRIARIERESDEDYTLKEAGRLMKLGALEDAARYYRRAYEKKPDDKEIGKKLGECYAALAEYYFERRDLKRAEATYNRLAKFDSPGAKTGLAAVRKIISDATNREKAADAFFEIGQYDEALSQYEKVLKDVPFRRADLYGKMASCHLELGDASMSIRDYATAGQDYDKALEYNPALLPFLEPRWTAAKAARIQALLGKQRYKEARNSCRAALSILPESSALNFLLGEAYLGLELESLARESYRKAVPGYVITPSTTIRDLRNEALKRLLPPEKAAKRAEEEKRWKKVQPGKTRRLETAHFIIHHRNDYVAARVAKVLRAGRLRAGLPWKNEALE